MIATTREAKMTDVFSWQNRAMQRNIERVISHLKPMATDRPKHEIDAIIEKIRELNGPLRAANDA